MAKKRRAETREGMVQTSITLPHELQRRLAQLALVQNARCRC